MSTTPPATPAREKPIKGWEAIALAVNEAIDDDVHVQTIRRWARSGAVHRLPVQVFAATRRVFLLPSHLELWARTRGLPLGARPPGKPKADPTRPFKREKAA